MKAASLLAALALAAGAAAAQPRPAAPARAATVETFEVGENVYVRALMVEPKRNALWIGTSAGVNEIDLATRSRRSTFTRSDGLANEYVFAIGIDREDHKWFGTNAGGAARYKDGKWKTYFPLHGLADYWIYAFASDRGGNLWIGTWAGASHFNLKTGKFTNYVKELVNEWVYGVAVDAKDRVWFATEGGVSMLEGKSKTWRAWTHKDGLGAANAADLPPSANTGLGTRSRHDLNVLAEGAPTYNPSYVFAIHVAPDGTIFAGTWGGGVSRFDGKGWKNLTSADGLAGNIVYSIAQDADGALWFGTDRGVSRWDGKSWRNFGRKEGLLADHVYALAVAPNGDVWAGTKRGVARIARAPSNVRK